MVSRWDAGRLLTNNRQLCFCWEAGADHYLSPGGKLVAVGKEQVTGEGASCRHEFTPGPPSLDPDSLTRSACLRCTARCRYVQPRPEGRRCLLVVSGCVVWGPPGVEVWARMQGLWESEGRSSFNLLPICCRKFVEQALAAVNVNA